MNEHTPGPWTLHEPPDVQFYPFIDLERLFAGYIVDARREGVASAYRYSTLPYTEQKANFSLICAAPELLAALEGVEWVAVPIGWGSSEYRCPWCEETNEHGHSPDCPRQAAIAKAKGAT